MSPPIFAAVMAKRGTRWQWAFSTIVPWLSLAVYQTVLTCNASFINRNNWRWILTSGDGRSYELLWIIRGWIAVTLSAIAGLSMARIVGMRRSTVPRKSNS